MLSKDNECERPLLLELETKQLEVDLFLDAVFRQYGYDFKHYAKPSLYRRIQICLEREKKQHISELIPCMIHDKYCFDRFLQDMSVTVTSMFRDPDLFRLLREEVIPVLHTYPTINVWLAGCATGEEVYSLAIVLKESGVLNRSRIYATDYNNASLMQAKKGIYPLDNFMAYQESYRVSGGEFALADYYRQVDQSVIFSKELRDRMVFAHHNFMKDGVFAQMHLVLCRNVLIYFDHPLKERALKVLTQSLVHRGFLMLGDRESLDCSEYKSYFQPLQHCHSIFRKKLMAS